MSIAIIQRRARATKPSSIIKPRFKTGRIASCLAGAAAIASGTKLHGFLSDQFSNAMPVGNVSVGPSPSPGGEVMRGLGAVLWTWFKRLIKVSFMASMVAIGQYFFVHFSKKWDQDSLPSMTLGSMRNMTNGGAAGVGMGGSGSSTGGHSTLLGGPTTATSASAPRQVKLDFEEYKD